jgi:hypothetical protein
MLHDLLISDFAVEIAQRVGVSLHSKDAGAHTGAPLQLDATTTIAPHKLIGKRAAVYNIRAQVKLISSVSLMRNFSWIPQDGHP